MTTQIVDLDLASVERSVGTLTNGKPTDVYRAEAAKMFSVKEDQVTTEQRRYAKTVLFYKIYHR